jgi:hypothetical protein
MDVTPRVAFGKQPVLIAGPGITEQNRPHPVLSPGKSQRRLLSWGADIIVIRLLFCLERMLALVAPLQTHTDSPPGVNLAILK